MVVWQRDFEGRSALRDDCLSIKGNFLNISLSEMSKCVFQSCLDRSKNPHIFPATPRSVFETVRKLFLTCPKFFQNFFQTSPELFVIILHKYSQNFFVVSSKFTQDFLKRLQKTFRVFLKHSRNQITNSSQHFSI